MLNLDVTAVNLAVPSIAQQFHASLANVQWVINAFILVSAMLQILGGHLGDTFERRSMFFLGTLLFIISSLVCAIAPNLSCLITGRILQGISLGLAYPVSIVIANAVFPKEEHGFVMGVIMGVMGFSLALGPTIGGYLVEVANWRWIFFINVPIGLITLLMTFFKVPKLPADKPPSLDIPGTITLMVGLGLTILAINQSQVWGFTSSLFLTCITAGLSCFILLYFIERRTPEPIVDFSLFSNRNFNINIIVRVIAQVVFIPTLFFIPLYLVNVASLSPVHAGLSVLTLTSIIALISPFAGKSVDRFGDKLHTLLSMVFYASGAAFLYTLQAQPNLIILIMGLILIGIACSINFVSTTVGTLNAVNKDSSGVATGVLFTVVWASCSLGIAVCGTILGLVSQETVLSTLKTQAISLTQLELSQLIRAAQGVSHFEDLSRFFPNTLMSSLHKLADFAFMDGFHMMFAFLFLCSLMGLILSLFLKTEKNEVTM
jgi:EmrB/QacA subfamily drug resistance transporter